MGKEKKRGCAQATKPPTTNTDAIARIRGVDSTAAAEFWSRVNAVAQRRLSTYEVLVLLRAQREQASTISAEALASTVPALDAPPTAARQPTVPRAISTAKTPREDHPTKPTTTNPRQTASPDLQATLAQRYDLGPVETEELYKLLAFMTPMGFTTSKQLSNFIATHQLEHQYPNISGIVRMEQNGIEWDLRGGFPRRIYAIVCDELGLSNQGTRARPVGFTPFKDLYTG